MTRVLSSRAFKLLVTLSLFSFLFLALFSKQARADDLNFYQNYFVTGGSLTSGVGLATAPGGQGTISLTGANGVPCRSGGNPPYTFPVACTTANAVPADIVAAYMYWEVVEDPTVAIQPAATIGYLDGNAFRGEALGTDSTSKCWSTAANQVLRVYRADIRRFLPIQQFGNPDPSKSVGVRVVNGTHTVNIGYTKTGTKLNGVLFPEGASMVVVYRVFVPGVPLAAPLVAVTIYDGVHTISKNGPSLTLNAAGFYQATGSGATMTNIVGGGDSKTTVPFRVNNDNLGPHIFSGAAGANWDNPTLSIPLNPNDSSYVVGTQSTNDHTCLSWGAVVSTIPVVDTDHDGLLDVWESKGYHENTSVSPATFGGCADYPSEPCLNLPAMGAKNGVKDLFIHFDWMHQVTPGPLGSGGTDGMGTHDHAPKAAALLAVCQTFASNGVAAHFDVGNNYQGQQCIVPAAYANGGHDDDESAFICPTGPLPPSENVCTYNEKYAVLGWKGGFQTVRDGHSASNPLHFQHFEKDAVHYLLLAHALAGPFCPPNGVNPLNAGNPCTPGMALTTDPSSVSGIADRPGADVMITFGLWGNANGPDDKVGTVLQQAGTILHEVGHNLGLFHGGVTRENCMVDYPSSMSYLYQTRGLDDSSGTPHIAYSYGMLAPLNEDALSSSASLGFWLSSWPLQYKPRFYAPLNAKNTPDQIAKVHCDGSPTNGAQMILIENATVATPDWSNGTVTPPYSNFVSDVNFNGVSGETFADVNDWASLNFQQISPRPNFFGLSTDSGITDAGITDAGITDAGITDAGITDAGITDAGITDAGITDAGITDAGITDAGITDAGITDAGTGLPEIDAPTLVKSGAADPPATLTLVQELNDIAVRLPPPSVVVQGATVQYVVYRCNATPGPCDPTGNYLLTFSAASPHNGGSCTFSDGAPCFADIVNDTNPYHSGATCPADNVHTCYNTTYTYKVTTDETLTDSSGTTTTAVDTSLLASGEVMHLFVIADNKAHITYGAANPTPTSTTYGDGGSVAGVTCAYYPSGTPGTLPLPAAVTPRNVGAYAILCSSNATTGSGGANVGVSYNVTYLTNVPGTLTIDPRAITVTAASAKVYDGNNNCPIPSCTAGPGVTWAGSGPALAYTDTPNFSESFDNKNVGTTHTVTPAGTVNDGGYPVGSNYTYHFVSINTGAITPATLTITASSNTKTYDGTQSAAAIPTASVVCGGITVTGMSALCGTDTVTGLTETYDDPNAGTGKSLSVGATYTVNDLNGGKNYTVVTVRNTTGVINAAPVTATAGGYSGTYDGGSHSMSACAVTPIAPNTYFGTLTCTNNPASVGPNVGSGSGTPQVSGGNGNFAVTPVNGTWSITPATSSVAVICPASVTYTGLPQTPCSATVTGAGGLNLTGLTPTYGSNTNSGQATASYTYAGDGNHTGNSSSGTFVINKAPATVVLSNLTQTYTGSPLTPTAATTPPGLAIVWTGALDTNAGSYPVTATVTDPNYTGSANGTFNINKATATLVLSNLTQTYTGSPLTPTAVTTPPGLAIVWAGAPDTNVGSYPVTATVTDPNYTGSANGTFNINKATATLVLSNLTQTYTGSPLMPTVATTPLGLATVWTGAPDTNAGSYPVTATVTDPNYTGSANSTFNINKATATLVLSNLTQTYTGGPLTPTAVTTPPGLAIVWTGAPDTNAGGYPVTATVTDPNYTGSANGTFNINKATATLVLSNLTQTYTGSPLTPTAVTTPPGLAIVWTGAPGTNAGSYPVTATVTDPNYTGSANGTFNINKATATLVLSNLTQTYTGSPLMPTVATTPLGLATVWTGAPDTNAGSYPVTATVTDPNYTGSANSTFNINKATATVVLSNLTQIYTGSPLTPTVVTTPPGLAIVWTGAPDTNAGSYPVTATVTDANYTGSASGTFVIHTPPDIDFTALLRVGSPTSSVSTATKSVLTMTSDINQTSAAWLPTKQAVGNGFTTQFKFQISSGNTTAIADGFAFVIQNSAAGTGSLGTTGMGGYLGYQGLTNSIAIEFDTYENGWDPNANHVAIQSNYTGANTADHTMASLAVVNPSITTNLSDGMSHVVIITYDGSSTLTVTLDGTLVLAASVNLSSLGLDAGGNAVVGFTAATGANSETTKISGWTFSSN